jgi:hypothetical protein
MAAQKVALKADRSAAQKGALMNDQMTAKKIG